MEKIKSRLTERDTTQQRLTGNGSEGQEYALDLLELFYRLLENAKSIAVAELIGALLAWSYTVVVVAPKYTATSKLYVLNTGDSAINLSDLQIGNYLASD